jgi:serine protease inhibitor
MQRKSLYLPFLLFSLFLIFPMGCESGSSSDPIENDFDTVKSNKSRELEPAVQSSTMDELVDGNSAFAMDLYQMVKSNEDGNFFYSPHSISIALAMTYVGAKGDTKTQMADVLGFTLDDSELHAAFNTLDLDLSSRGTGDASQFRLSIANAIWGQQGYHFEADFLDTIAVNYGSGLNLLDFATDSNGSRIIINDWVEDKTEGKIVDLLPQGSITAYTKLVLTNAIYFWAEWVEMFAKDATMDSIFHKDDGSDVTAEFMNIESMFPYYQGTGYQVVELPYKGDDTSMIIIVPDAGTMDSFEVTIDASFMESAISALQSTHMTFSMPKFSFEYTLGLKQILIDMGMSDAFDDGKADFSGINGNTDLAISDVLHKAFVAVNEDGTEAAAATAVIIGNTSVPQTNVKLDRPYIFIIRDKITKTVLFIGRIQDPTS